MNTNGLQKHYNKLTTQERFALLVAAAARVDKQELTALLESAPRVRFSLPETFGHWQALTLTAYDYLACQLDTAANVLLLAHMDDPTGKYFGGAVFGAHVFCTRADAWSMFCGELGIDPAAPLQGMPGLEILYMQEQIARRVLPPYAEVATLMHKHLGTDAHPITVEEMLLQMRAKFNHIVEDW